MLEWEQVIVVSTRFAAVWVLLELARALRASARREAIGDMGPVLESLQKIRKLFEQIDGHMAKNRIGSETATHSKADKEDPLNYN